MYDWKGPKSLEIPRFNKHTAVNDISEWILQLNVEIIKKINSFEKNIFK